MNYESEREHFLKIAEQQSHNYKILFPSLSKAIVDKYQLKEIDKYFIDFCLDLLSEAVPDKYRYFAQDACILEDSMMYKRSGRCSFDNRYEFINLLLCYSRNVDGIESFNKDIVKFYNYYSENSLDFKGDEFIGICAYLNAHPDYAAEKLTEIDNEYNKFKIHFDL